MRRAGRRFLLVGLVATPVVFAAMTFLLLRPPGRADSAIAAVSALSPTPTYIVLKDLGGLDALAHSRRAASGLPVMGRTSSRDLPVWVFRIGDDVRAFIARDPRDGCPLVLYSRDGSVDHRAVSGGALFHDTCHGSLYDDQGRPIDGPSPFYLDRLVLTIKDDAVFASTTDVQVGQFLLPQR